MIRMKERESERVGERRHCHQLNHTNLQNVNQIKSSVSRTSAQVNNCSARCIDTVWPGPVHWVEKRREEDKIDSVNCLLAN